MMKLFRIRLNDESEADQEMLNAFLEKFVVKESFTQLVTGHPPYWSVLLYYDEDSVDEKAWLKSMMNYHLSKEDNTENPDEQTPEETKPPAKRKRINSAEVIENIPDKTDEKKELDEKSLLRLEKLKSWRYETCRKMNIPSYIVASNATLEEIAIVNPPDIKSLIDIKGMGRQKILKYGSDIISVIQSSETVSN